MHIWKSPPGEGRRFPRIGQLANGLGYGQVDTSGTVDADLVEEVEPGSEGHLEIGVSCSVAVTDFTVSPGAMHVWLLTPPPTRSLFILLGHCGLLISRMSRSAPDGRSTITIQLFIDYANLSMIANCPLVGAKASNKTADFHERKGLIEFTNGSTCLLL